MANIKKAAKDKRVRITLTIPAWKMAEVRKEAAERGVSVSRIVEESLDRRAGR